MSRATSSLPRTAAAHAVLILYTVIALFPVVVIVINSFKSRNAIFRSPLSLPTPETFDLVGYTTVLKLLQIMTDKGLVDRDETQRAHVYQPRVSREATQTRLVAELADRAFGGSAMARMASAIGSRKATRAELAEMRRLLDEAEGRAR